jgi:hypothetical protein
MGSIGRIMLSFVNFIDKIKNILGDFGTEAKLFTLLYVIDAVSVDGKESVLTLASNTTTILTLRGKEIAFGDNVVSCSKLS